MPEDNEIKPVGEFPVYPVDPGVLGAVIQRAQVTTHDDGGYFTSVPELQGIWGYGKSAEEALADLKDSLPAWISFHVWRRLPLPALPSIDLAAAVAV